MSRLAQKFREIASKESMAAFSKNKAGMVQAQEDTSWRMEVTVGGSGLTAEL